MYITEREPTPCFDPKLWQRYTLIQLNINDLLILLKNYTLCRGQNFDRRSFIFLGLFRGSEVPTISVYRFGIPEVKR